MKRRNLQDVVGDLDEFEDDYNEQSEMQQGVAYGTAKDFVFNKIGFAEPQREKLPLHIKYRNNGKYLDFAFWTEIDGNTIDFEIHCKNKKELAQIAEILQNYFGQYRVYEQ